MAHQPTINDYFVCIGAQKAGTTWLARVLARHPDIFPGFFQLDSQEKILPKLRMLQDFGFYAAEPEEEGTDSCGAHSPRVAQTGGTVVESKV